MKKVLLLIGACLCLHAHAQIESTQYGFTGTANNSEKGESTRITLPAQFAMKEWQGIVLYEDAEGFKLTDETRYIKFDWSEYTNNDTRLAFTYTAKWTVEGVEKTVEQNAREEWMPLNISKTYDIMAEPGRDDENGINHILKADPNAEIIIKKIRLNNFCSKEGATIMYGLNSLNIAGKEITELPSSSDTFATPYSGTFTVQNHGAQACNISRFEIPEQYRGTYVRIDFGTEPANVWGLNLAFNNADGNGCGGWTDINGYTKKIETSRYYAIPANAVTMNPQIWKNVEDTDSWAVDIAGFYLTTGFDASSVYTDEYFPLDASQMEVNMWTAENTTNQFDHETKTITFGDSYNQCGWRYSSASFNDYKYMVIAANPSANAYITLNFVADGDNYCPYTAEKQQICLNNETTHITIDMTKAILSTNDKFEKTTSFANVTGFSDFHFWQSWETNRVLPLANVFLTNTEPNWNTPETRTTQEGNYGTVCLPYPAICQGGYVYKITGKSSVGDIIYFEPYNGVMTAGMPYIYKSIGDGVKFYQIESEDVKSSAASTANGLVGCLDNMTVEANENRYALNKDNVWYKIDKTITTNRRAYIDMSQINVMEEEGSTENLVAMRILIPEDANGIKAVTTEQSKDNAVYTLSGIRVDNTRKLNKGIYIRSGKKFIVK